MSPHNQQKRTRMSLSIFIHECRSAPIFRLVSWAVSRMLHRHLKHSACCFMLVCRFSEQSRPTVRLLRSDSPKYFSERRRSIYKRKKEAEVKTRLLSLASYVQSYQSMILTDSAGPTSRGCSTLTSDFPIQVAMPSSSTPGGIPEIIWESGTSSTADRHWNRGSRNIRRIRDVATQPAGSRQAYRY
ncbi:hypothetical protein AFLA_009286 [Aspergillus flavus NRRL3357]|nr:hypothetical protein AFLA_009286 [Aspergillus flavus NRRL3357]